MARISDAERITRLLESEGGSLGRRAITEALGLSDARYDAVANELCQEEIVAKNRGRAGGLRLLSVASAPRATPRATREPEEVPLERDLYAPFERYLLTAAKENDMSRSVVLRTYPTRGGKWETPDLAEVRVTPFPMIGQWELRVATYELKRQDAWSVDSVLQAAMYTEFAHESWLVVPAGGEEDWTTYFGRRIVDKAGDLGVGLATFDGKNRTLWKHTTPRPHVPSLSRLHEWLETTIERIGEDKKKTEIADNIGWAARKAAAGRD